METSSSSPRVVRSGSTKSSNTASPVPSRAPIKIRSNNKEEEIATTTTLSMRSLSQPTGLDRISRHHHHPNRTDEEACSDTDSISSTTNDTESIPARTTETITTREPEAGEQPCYAEVLYNFKPGGPEELPLQKGDLVEVIKKDTGPWWWGQIKLDSLVATAVQGQQAPYGWFPKDFVRILPNFVKPHTPRKQQQHQSRRHHHHHHHRRSRSQDPQAVHVTESEDDESETELNVPNVVEDPERTSQQTNEMMRQNAVKELINAESVYVSLLESLCIGWVTYLSVQSNNRRLIH